MRARLMFVGIVLFSFAAIGCNQSAETPDAAFTRLVSETCAEISPSSPQLSQDAGKLLTNAVGSATLVAVGESRHDTHEQIKIKHQLFAHLVNEMDFTMLILEESFYHAQALDQYVTTGDGDPRVLMNQLAGWYLWDTEEMLALVEWIRDANTQRAPDEMIHIYGMDITAPARGVREALAWLESNGVSTGITEETLRLDLHEGDFWPGIWSAYSTLSAEEREALATQYDTLVDAFAVLEENAQSPETADEFLTMQMHARIGQSGNELFSSEDRAAGGEIRERGMFAVVRHILNHKSPDAKAMIWTHNLHAASSTFRMPSFGENTFTPVGMLLKEEYGDLYLSVGAAFGTGSYPANLPPGARDFELMSDQTVDGALASTVPYSFLVDLRAIATNPQASQWLSVEREWRAQELSSFMVPGDAFDLVFFVQTVSRARLTPLALTRFQSMGG